MANRLERYAPVWRGDRQDVRLTRLTLIALFAVSLAFFPPFLAERDELVTYGSHSFAIGALNLGIGLRMAPFWVLARRFLVPLPFAAAAFLFIGVAQNYLSSRSGARADYTLRRLGDPWEYHRRCFALPALEALSCLLLFALLTGVYYALYLRLTPTELLLPAGQRFWG